ncbi:MAG TPA: Uma2 family endonuclease [Acidimicrobiales bacterium]|nr:Uma2 family endonuclease [Acidimicrobiales bacterium]
MKTVILGDPPPEIVALIARRHALDQDRSDEVWEGDYHMVPAPHPWHGYVWHRLAVLLDQAARAAGLAGTSEFNLGVQGDFRVPDAGYHRGLPSVLYVPTAAIVVEVLSPGDETWLKFGFYARHGVEEICVADPEAGTIHRIRWFRLAGDAYEEVDRSDLLGVSAADLEAAIDWPG